MPDNTTYLCMDLIRWNNCRLSHLPDGYFDGLNNGSIGFMPVFDNIDELKVAYPDDVEIVEMIRSGGEE